MMGFMKGHGLLLRAAVMTVLALAFIAGHAIALFNGSSLTILPMAALASAMIVLAVVKHLGLFGAFLAFVRKRLS